MSKIALNTWSPIRFVIAKNNSSSWEAPLYPSLGTFTSTPVLMRLLASQLSRRFLALDWLFLPAT